MNRTTISTLWFDIQFKSNITNSDMLSIVTEIFVRYCRNQNKYSWSSSWRNNSEIPDSFIKMPPTVSKKPSGLNQKSTAVSIHNEDCKNFINLRKMTSTSSSLYNDIRFIRKVFHSILSKSNFMLKISRNIHANNWNQKLFYTFEYKTRFIWSRN